jgi:hypothetical protein
MYAKLPFLNAGDAEYCQADKRSERVRLAVIHITVLDAHYLPPHNRSTRIVQRDPPIGTRHWFIVVLMAGVVEEAGLGAWPSCRPRNVHKTEAGIFRRIRRGSAEVRLKYDWRRGIASSIAWVMHVSGRHRESQNETNRR